ncbi:hypothetical protein QUA86_18720 [Microcoleus sp. F6_B6]
MNSLILISPSKGEAFNQFFLVTASSPKIDSDFLYLELLIN